MYTWYQGFFTIYIEKTPDIQEGRVQQRVFWCGNASPHTLRTHTAKNERRNRTFVTRMRLFLAIKTIEIIIDFLSWQMLCVKWKVVILMRPEINLPGYHPPSQHWIWRSTSKTWSPPSNTCSPHPPRQPAFRTMKIRFVGWSYNF